MGADLSVSDGSWDHIDDSFIHPTGKSQPLAVPISSKSTIRHTPAPHQLHDLVRPVPSSWTGSSSSASNRPQFDIPRISDFSHPLTRPDPPAGSTAPTHSDTPLAWPIAQSPVIWSLKRQAPSENTSLDSVRFTDSPKSCGFTALPLTWAQRCWVLSVQQLLRWFRSVNAVRMQCWCRNGSVFYRNWENIQMFGLCCKNLRIGRNMQVGFWMALHRALHWNTFQLVWHFFKPWMNYVSNFIILLKFNWLTFCDHVTG